MERDLTRGSIRKGLVLFSLPLIAGNLLQQCYNIVDTWVVGRFLGSVALAYWLAPSWGLDAVWWAIPIGWAAADATGLMALKHSMTSLRTR